MGTVATSSNKPISNRYRRYILFILTGVYVFNFIDRQILVILQESIKQELGLSDTQLGLMSGFTFALFYVTFGLPIARLADKGNRRNIIALALTVWSGMTALCGLAQNFFQLLLARMGVGIGEAGGSPPAHSMLSDLYPPEKRATAMAIYSSGISIGVLFGFLAGGWINQYFGWRAAFMVVGIPGILFALILRFTVREPMRKLGHLEKSNDTPPLSTVFKRLWGSKTFRFLALGASMAGYVGYTITAWLPPFYARIHGMESGAIGTWLSLLFGIGGGLGYFMGGYLSDHLGKKDKRWYVWFPAIALLLAIPFLLSSYLLGHTVFSLLSIGIPAFCVSVYLAPSVAVTHGIVSNRMRSLASAILFFVLNIIGMGCGPLITGVISDYLEPSYGKEALRWALCISIFANLLGAYFYFKAGKTIQEELAE